MRPEKKQNVVLLCIFAIMMSLTYFTAEVAAQPRPEMAPARPVPAMAPAPRPVPRPAARPAPAAPKPAMAPAAMAVVPKPAAASTTAPEAPKPATKPAAKADSWGKVLAGRLLDILLIFVLALATALGGLLVKWLAKKMKITDQEQIKSMEGLYDLAVGFGINLARQQSHKLKDNPDAKAKRLDTALGAVQDKIAELKLPEKTADWIRKKIEAKIGEEERK